MRIGILLLLLAAAGVAQEPTAPLLVYSGYFGGDRNEFGTAAATGVDGQTYIAGETLSRNFSAKPLTGTAPAATNNGFVCKLNATGNEMAWCVLIGGDSATRPNAIAADADGNVYVTGRTGSRNFPLKNPVQDKHTGLNIAFLMKLSPEGELLFSTLFGGERNDEPNAIALDSQGNILIAGRTNSTTFPVQNAFQPNTGGGGDAFVAKFTPDYKLAWSSWFGGPGADEIFGIGLGPDDSVFVTGETYSQNLATEGAWQTKLYGVSGFVAKIRPRGESVEWCTYVGGRPGYTRTQAIVVDAAGSAWVGGHTSVKEMPTTEHAVQPVFAGGFRDALLLKLTADGSAAEYLSYLGGASNGKTDPDETITALRLDSHGHVYILGETQAPDFGVARALQGTQAGAEDVFLTRFDPLNTRIVSSTFWGGSKGDQAPALALGPGENATIAGQTSSSDLRLENPVRKEMGSAMDLFVSRFCDPWLSSAPGEVNIGWVNDQPAPAEIILDVYSGCTTKHEATAIVSSESWLSVAPAEGSVPMPMPGKIRLTVNTADLAPGEYKATITVAVPQAANGPLVIPVVLTVSDPPPAE
jgi:hypothetical protein